MSNIKIDNRQRPIWHDVSLLSDDDLYLFNEGTHHQIWQKLGSHLITHRETSGTYFAVWAPNARRVSVIVPAWLGFSSTALHALSAAAAVMRSAFVTR